MKKYIAFYWQHFCAETEEFETLQEAIRFLEYGSDYGELYSVGVFLEDKLYWTDNSITSHEECQADYDKYLLTHKQ